MFLDVGKKIMALRIGSSLPDLYIKAIGIGTGSSTVLSGNTALANEVNRQLITNSPDFTTAKKVTFQGDFNSVQMSGITLTEIGLFSTGSNTNWTGSIWQRECFGSLVFDGTNELQVITTLEVL
jgi:hypothetical protein